MKKMFDYPFAYGIITWLILEFGWDILFRKTFFTEAWWTGKLRDTIVIVIVTFIFRKFLFTKLDDKK